MNVSLSMVIWPNTGVALALLKQQAASTAAACIFSYRFLNGFGIVASRDLDNWLLISGVLLGGNNVRWADEHINSQHIPTNLSLHKLKANYLGGFRSPGVLHGSIPHVIVPVAVTCAVIVAAAAEAYRLLGLGKSLT